MTQHGRRASNPARRRAASQAARLFAVLAEDKGRPGKHALLLSTAAPAAAGPALYVVKDAGAPADAQGLQARHAQRAPVARGCRAHLKRARRHAQEALAVGVVRGGDAGGALLRLMSALFQPAALADDAWPAVVRKEFTGAAGPAAAHRHAERSSAARRADARAGAAQASCSASWRR